MITLSLGVTELPYGGAPTFEMDSVLACVAEDWKVNTISGGTRQIITLCEERIPTRCNNIDDLLSISDVDY